MINRCIRCGKPLKNKYSIEIGLGPLCEKKYKESSENIHKLSDYDI